MNSVQCVLIILTISFVLSFGKKLPSFIPQCQYTKNGEVLGDCITNVFHELKDKFVEGVPELHIPALDPFIVDEIDFNTGRGSKIGLESKFSNVKIFGTKHVILERINIDIENGICTLAIYFPKLQITSGYRLTGQVMILKLNGTGQARGNFSDIRATNHYQGKFVIRHNKEYLEWFDHKLNLTIGKANMYFDNLFADNKEMTETTNKILNENSDEIITELKPLVEETIATITFTILQRVFHTFSVDELFIR